MRILGIRFKNINSLAGEWQVDFTQPEYTADGIFAITGPTGAGKTTLLDVICLALYGRTPRLERVNKSGNDVMTRQTGECFAEVTFSTPAGTFRCHWSQHRARKKAEGDLQTPKHEISNADSGQIIDNQIRTVEKRIEATTGMDFQRFTQSMMLAQGGFEAFLKASADERAPILEQITGTGIYSEISIKVHERHTRERDLLQMLESQLSGFQLLTPQQEAALKAEESAKADELSEQQTVLNQKRQQHEWKRQCLKLEQNITELNSDQQHWQQQHEAFSTQREQLDKANRALELSGHYSALCALRQNQQDDEQRELSAAQSEPALQQNVAQKLNIHQQAEMAHQQKNDELIRMRPIFKQVHVLDSKIEQQRTQLHRVQAEYTKLGVDFDATQQQAGKMQAAVAQATLTLTPLQLDGEIGYESLLKRLTHEQEQNQLQSEAIKTNIDLLSEGKPPSHWRLQSDQLTQALSLCDALAQRYQEREILYKKLQLRQHQIKETGAEIAALSERLQQCDKLVVARESLTHSLKKEADLLQIIKNLETHRAQLIDGEPCPLCGSPEHPYASHAPDAEVGILNDQIRDADRLLTESREQHQQLSHKKLQQQEKLVYQNSQYEEEQHSLISLDKKIAMQCQQINLASINLDSEVPIDQYRAHLTGERDSIRQILNKLDTEQQKLAALDQTAGEAREKLNSVKETVAALSHSQERLQDCQLQLGKILKQKSAALAECELQQQVLDRLSAERQQLLADQNADQLETQLESELVNTGLALQSTLVQYQHAGKQLEDNRQLRKSLAQQISQRANKIHTAENDFNILLQSKDFKNEQDYLAATLSDSDRQQLRLQADQLTQRGTELQALINQTTSELESLVQQALSSGSLETLQQVVDEQDKRVSLLRESLGGIRRDLSNNEMVRVKQRQQTEKIDAQKAESGRWAELHLLIGSADGKKFRNFAQGLTFELMISHANQQLAKMTDRYLLLRDKIQPLDLNVIDHYQAGEIRSTKNLSGGESFIVSLALALGLSRMASRNVRVDSLFLDEGFGTLDEEALDTALETLASLQQEGKLIGVISHVSALKERISTQIKVSPGTGGRSTLIGPGCRGLG